MTTRSYSGTVYNWIPMYRSIRTNVAIRNYLSPLTIPLCSCRIIVRSLGNNVLISKWLVYNKSWIGSEIWSPLTCGGYEFIIRVTKATDLPHILWQRRHGDGTCEKKGRDRLGLDKRLERQIDLHSIPEGKRTVRLISIARDPTTIGIAFEYHTLVLGVTEEWHMLGFRMHHHQLH